MGRSKYEDRLTHFWRGRREVKLGIVQLVWAAARFTMGSWFWSIAVRLAHFQPPTKTIGVVVALVSISLILWAIWGLGKSILILGLRRILFIFLAAYLVLVTVNVLTLPDTRPVGPQILAQIGVSVRQIASACTKWVSSIVQAPDDFLFAYSGQREISALPLGFATPVPNATPVHATTSEGAELPVKIPTPQLDLSFAPSTEASQSTSPDAHAGGFEIGGYALVVNTGGQSLRARLEPTTSSDIVIGFAQDSRLLILEGPVVKDGFTWWKVRSEDNREGWCADYWLEPTTDE